MKPLEKCILPMNSDLVDPYINGASLRLDKAPYIAERKLYLPVVELSKVLEISVNFNDGIINIENGGNQYRIDSSTVYNVTAGGEEPLSYLVRNSGTDVYVQAEFFTNEINVTAAWEEETCSLYLATVLHYDGYRYAPVSIYKKSEENNQYAGMYLFVDGTVNGQEGNVILVETSDGKIYLGLRRPMTFEENHQYRFCFNFNANQYVGDIPTGNLMELVEPDNRFRIGNMIYTQQSFISFDGIDIQKEEEQKCILGFDKDALIGMFKQYPDILKDRKRFQAFLNDLFPGKKRNVNLFLTAYDNDIVSGIEDNELNDIFVHQMIKLMVEDYGIQIEYATETVCLWCEIYGTRILGKTFIAKKKFDADIQQVLMDREAEWRSPNMSSYKTIGNLLYHEPSGWDYKPATEPYEGTYYYPYSDGSTGLIWVTKKANIAPIEGGRFVYNGMIAGMVDEDMSKVISATDVVVGGIEGKKVNYMKQIKGMDMEIDTYILPQKDNIYMVSFGERLGICSAMLKFEEEFMGMIKQL